MPALAKERTKAGAKAFVRYYIDVLNYAVAELSVAEIRGLSTPTCRACRGVTRSIQQMIAKGGYQHGGIWTLETLVVIPAQPANAPIINATVTVAHGIYRKSANSQPVEIHGGSVNDDFHLKWSDERWHVAKLVVS